MRGSGVRVPSAAPHRRAGRRLRPSPPMGKSEYPQGDGWFVGARPGILPRSAPPATGARVRPGRSWPTARGGPRCAVFRRRDPRRARAHGGRQGPSGIAGLAPRRPPRDREHDPGHQRGPRAKYPLPPPIPCDRHHASTKKPCGGVPEWSIGAVSKTVVGVTPPWVRIPPPPPLAPAKAFSRSGGGRIFPLYSGVMREGLLTGPRAEGHTRILSGPIFSGPVNRRRSG
jgi:hypothetical protein